VLRRKIGATKKPRAEVSILERGFNIEDVLSTTGGIMSGRPFGNGDTRQRSVMNSRKRKSHAAQENKDGALPKFVRKGEDPWRVRKNQLKNVDVEDLDDYLLDTEV
jgi:hypothetical protein